VSISEEQKLYLEGFIRGVTARQAGTPGALSSALAGLAGSPAPESAALTAGPPDPALVHRQAQDRFVAAGQKLAAEEEAKRSKNPFDMWDEMQANARAGRFPKGTDVFLHKFHGLFYVAPNQNSFMCRLRMPGGILSAHQFRGLAAIADTYGGGYADVTTRANLQIREISSTNAPPVLTSIQELGLTSRGAGADNIRNVTGSPTAGIDPQELIDTRPLCRALHHHILNHRELYGLPRKFNIAFDGGGQVGVLEDTNDIGFTAVRVEEGQSVPAGVYFRMALGGITGHGSFAADTGIVLSPEECVAAAAAVVRVFIENGDRTDRKKARLKYVLERWGLEKYLAETRKHLPFELRRLPMEACRPRAPRLKDGHIGVHPQRQGDLSYIGVVAPVGRLRSEQMRALADVAERFGSGVLRLTVWQNLLISDIPDSALAPAQEEIGRAGLRWDTGGIGGSVVACTGNSGCKFSASDTKAHALAIVRQLEGRVALDRPVNIHLTGCPNSCAQHAIADIGLLGIKIGEDAVEGYHVSVGGAAGDTQVLARELYRDVTAEELPALIEYMLRAYLVERRADETFQDFTARHGLEELQRLFAVPDRRVEAA
jgi:ferredoxin-nitrite reductase